VSPRIRSFLFAAIFAAAALPAAGQPSEILAADKVVAGMKGYGLSDLGDGKGIQRFDVEIIGTMKRFAPGQDMILARVSGAGLERSGIIAGMSGSPIYVEDKLVGALAYGWPFSKDAICGITPIQSMLDIRKAPAAAPVPIAGATVSTGGLIQALRDRHFVPALEALLAPFRPTQASGAMAPLPLPVSFSGGANASGLVSRLMEAAGWMATPSGGAAAPAALPGRLEPGSAISTVLLTGDMDLAATGTVTWVDGSSVLAFGHPFLSMGPVDMPMAEAQVLTILPSVFRSFKFSATGSVLGSVSQDRSSGILGNFGTRAAMVPVRVRLSSEDIPTQTFHFEVVHNSMLTPILAAMAIDNVLTTIEKRTGRAHARVEVLDPDSGSGDSVGYGLHRARRARRGGRFARAPHELPHGERIPGSDDHGSRRGHSALRPPSERPHRQRRGGSGPRASRRHRPHQRGSRGLPGSTRRATLAVRIPPDTPPGPLTVFIGDGGAATAYDLAMYPPDPRSLSQVLDFLARVRPPNSLNLFLDRRAPGAVVGGEPLAALPPTVGAVLLDRGPGSSGAPDLSAVRLEAQSVEQPVPVSGSVHLRLEVLQRLF
jgi:hypothetical protein